MALSIRFLDGDRADTRLEFGDDVQLIVFGRDASSCQVVFPPDEAKVGRQHFAIKHVLGRYRLVVDTEHEVRVDGKIAHDEQELPPAARLEVGPGGPRVMVEMEDRDGLHRTVFHGVRRPQIGEVLETTARSVRLSRLLLWATLVVVLGTAAVGGMLLLQTRETVQSISERQTNALDDVRKKMTGLEEQLSKMEPAMKEVLRRAARSSYLVLVRRDEGTEAGLGSAWVVAPGVLATNAHVAKTHGELEPGHTLVCRSSDSPPKDHVVESVDVHPGFGEFQRIWEEYAPLRKQLGERFEKLIAVAACDVALLRVSNPDALAPPLPIAAKADLVKLSSPDTVGFAGYPAEAMAVGGVNIRQPEPTVQVGHVTAVTDFFLAKDVSGEGRLLQHSLPITGGASGSPMLDARGNVVGVISAANFAFTQQGERLPIAVGVNFAQRADLVQELLDGHAAEAQAPRTREWEEGIKQFVSGGEMAKKAFADAKVLRLNELIDGWNQRTGLTGQRVSEQTGTLSATDPMGRHTARFTLRGLSARPRALIAMPAVEADIDMYVFRGGTEDILVSDEANDWWPAGAIAPDAPTDLDVTIVGPREGIVVTLYLYQAE